MMMILNLLRGFFWEWAFGKDVTFKDALKHHKFRLLFYLIFMISVFLNWRLVPRSIYWYDSFRTIEKRHQECKERVSLLEESNRKLIAHLGEKPLVENTPENIQQRAETITVQRDETRDAVLSASNTRNAAAEAYGVEPEDKGTKETQ